MELLNSKIRLGMSAIRNVLAFAKRCTDLRLKSYQERHPAPMEKVIVDIARGKIAEFGVYEYVKLLYPRTKEPDMGLYTSDAMRGIGHAPDLIGISESGKQLKIGIKACRSNDPDPSWVFQKNDPLNDTLYIFTLVDPIPHNESWGVTLRWVLTPQEVFRMQRPLRNKAWNKVAVYDTMLLSERGDEK